MVYFFNYYKSDAEFSEIKKFYDQNLTQNGWALEEPEDYRRGDYVIAVEKLERTEKHFGHSVHMASSMISNSFSKRT